MQYCLKDATQLKLSGNKLNGACFFEYFSNEQCVMYTHMLRGRKSVSWLKHSKSVFHC